MMCVDRIIPVRSHDSRAYVTGTEHRKREQMLLANFAPKHLLGIRALSAHQQQQHAHNDRHFEELAGLQTKTKLIKNFSQETVNFRLTTRVRCIFELIRAVFKFVTLSRAGRSTNAIFTGCAVIHASL